MLFSDSCLLVSCDCLVFWILCFDCSFRLIAWYLYFLLKGQKRKQFTNIYKSYYYELTHKYIDFWHEEYLRQGN